jgi:methyltransferase (TIGR00027 family)
LGVARARAWETRRPNPLFTDPYAAAFVAAAEEPETRPSEDPGSLRRRLGFQVIIRTRFYDDYLVRACESGCRQVVLLAAGLDTRAYRLPWPAEVRLWELDLPEVLSFKDRVLSQESATLHCQRTALPVDLREPWPAELMSAGFDPKLQTAWLIEGLLVYLSPDEAARVLTHVGELSAPDSRLSLERNNAATTVPTSARAGMEEYTSLWKGGLGPETPDWLSANGWQVEIHSLKDTAASYGRPIQTESTAGFLTATYRP